MPDAPPAVPAGPAGVPATGPLTLTTPAAIAIFGMTAFSAPPMMSLSAPPVSLLSPQPDTTATLTHSGMALKASSAVLAAVPTTDIASLTVPHGIFWTNDTPWSNTSASDFPRLRMSDITRGSARLVDSHLATRSMTGRKPSASAFCASSVTSARVDSARWYGP